MKTLMYISKAIRSKDSTSTVPIALASIYQRAKRTNVQMNISGVLLFRAGYYMQILEGEPETVDKLYRKIEQDARHEDINKLLDIEINNRYFPNWSMKLISNPEVESELKRFIKDYNTAFNRFTTNQKELLSNFIDIEVNKEIRPDDYKNYSFQITAWPDLSQAHDNPDLIYLSAELISGVKSYHQLLESANNSENLQKVLMLLNQQGLLVISKNEESKTELLKSFKRTGGKFFKKMRSILGVRNSYGL